MPARAALSIMARLPQRLPPCLCLNKCRCVRRRISAGSASRSRGWIARRAVETLKVSWAEPAAGIRNAMPANFSSDGWLATLAAAPGPGIDAEKEGDAAAVLPGAARVVEATYDAPYLAHGQLEPSSALARWNAEGTLDLWLPNQAPEMFQ